MVLDGYNYTSKILTVYVDIIQKNYTDTLLCVKNKSKKHFFEISSN